MVQVWRAYHVYATPGQQDATHVAFEAPRLLQRTVDASRRECLECLCRLLEPRSNELAAPVHPAVYSANRRLNADVSC